ncbi:hypothetical protein EGR_07991 [Echinococcus granulosus]|uniref:Uncharacterized protein n=1 Tax=Echinococcus granulosus TaxID=6210 RepID=W6UUU1_ECHGR|nr:hypothetical protein EGR_07991 [Echinococcus granulosus]EUB57174.1 hypothetical protein EGR_07991 [Echinococcus granulosus]
MSADGSSTSTGTSINQLTRDDNQMVADPGTSSRNNVNLNTPTFNIIHQQIPGTTTPDKKLSATQILERTSLKNRRDMSEEQAKRVGDSDNGSAGVECTDFYVSTRFVSLNVTAGLSVFGSLTSAIGFSPALPSIMYLPLQDSNSEITVAAIIRATVRKPTFLEHYFTR